VKEMAYVTMILALLAAGALLWGAMMESLNRTLQHLEVQRLHLEEILETTSP